jgi:hypothetical protein
MFISICLKVLAFWWEIETDNSVQPASKLCV